MAFRVVHATHGDEERWGVEWSSAEGEIEIIACFFTEDDAQAEATRLAQLEAETS